MTTIKSLLDHVCAGGVLKIGDLAQVTRTTRRNVVRWRYRSVHSPTRRGGTAP